MNKPTILIGSSSEGMPLTRALQQGLEHEAEILVWNQDVFSVGEYLLDTLLRSLDSVDLAVLVIIPEDVLTLRRRTIASMRDNVLFELGLFIGRLA